ncbi:MAG: TonB-dependent receptor [Steroidobacteraceae bacterium]
MTSARHNLAYSLWAAAAAGVGIGAPSLSLAAESTALEEIVVVAQRREENLQDVPISIQAFSEDALQNAGANNIAQLSTITPSLNMTQQLTSFTPSIRGVGSPDASAGQESTVATYVDGVYFAHANSSIFSFNNIDHVEVLKGPQGTLFGRNATGGLVHVITKDPTQETGFNGKMSYGDYDTVGAKLYGTTGITDSVSADLALFYQNQDKGWGDNLTTGADSERKKEKGVRTKWLITPSDDTEIRISADYAKLKTGQGIQKAVVPGSLGADGAIIFAGCVAQIGGDPTAPTLPQIGACQPVGAAAATRAPDDFYDTYADNKELMRSRTAGAAARIDHSFGALDFVSISAYRDTLVHDDFEQGGFPLPFVVIHINEQSHESFSQEFQLMSQMESWHWIVGAYFYDDESGFTGPEGISITGLATAAPQNIDALIKTKSYAAFGEATYSFTDDTHLTAGLRVTHDKRSIDQKIFISGTQVATGDDSKKWTEPTYRVVLDHQLVESTMVYGSYSRGFKSGNYNVTGNYSVPGSGPVDPEFIDAYEVGTKSVLWDNRVQLNAAAYYYDVKDLQLARIEAGSLVTVNAASAEIKGFEMDFLANATDQLQVRGGFSYVDGEYKKFPNAPVFLPNPLGIGGNIQTAADLSGKKLARTPKITWNLGGTFTVPSSMGEFALGANYYYNDGFTWEPAGRIEQDSYDLVSAFVSWKDPTEHWGVRIYGENLTDEEYASFALEQALGDNYAAAAPRTYGVELSYDF